MIGLSSNRCVIDGELLELDDLRYTPAGIPRIGLKIRHVSTQQEAGISRQLLCNIPAVALGEAALQVSRFQIGRVCKWKVSWLSAVCVSRNWCNTLITLN